MSNCSHFAQFFPSGLEILPWWNEARQRQGIAQVSEVECETLSQDSKPQVLGFLRED